MKVFVVVLLLLSVCSTYAAGLYPITDLPDDDLIAQLSQIDVATLMNGPDSMDLNETLVIELLEAKKMGSVLNSPGADTRWVPSVHEWRKIISRLHELSSQYGAKIPIIFGLDTVHGANYIWNATIFPQQIGVAATFNITCAYDTGRIGGMETRYVGIPWAFSPILGLAVQPSWARVFETFGEDTHLAKMMGVELISGLQSKPPAEMNLTGTEHNVAACMKHYIGYPDIRTGHDRTPVFMPTNVLLQYYAPPFQAAIDAGVLSAMENYIEVNGRPMVASSFFLKTMLRDIMGFEGMLVTDYNEIFNLYDFHRAAKSYEDAIQMSLSRTTIDMAMVGDYTSFPFVTDTIKNFMAEKKLKRERILESAQRVLDLKQKLGLLSGESPVSEPTGCVFGCESHRQAALDAARQSIILLQNDGVLPMKQPQEAGAPKKIAVIGQGCNSMGLQAGGWTIKWQGSSNRSAFPYGSTIFEEIQAAYGNNSVTFSEGCNVTENSVCGDDKLAEAKANAQAADIAIVCVGERHYAEKPGDIDDLTLPGGQIGMVEQLAAVQPNLVTVLIEGRPRILKTVPSNSRAVVHGMLPGPAGGQAIAEVLMGIVNPSGRLPITYPKTVNNAPIQYWRKYSANSTCDADDYQCFGDYIVQWQFGHGLSYTQFEYGEMDVQFQVTTATFNATFTVTNTGERAGDHSILMFSTQTAREITPEVQQLRAFTKIHLKAGETQTVMLAVGWKDLAYTDEFNCQSIEAGTFIFSLGNSVGNSGVSKSYDFPISNSWNCQQWGRIYSQYTSHGTQIKPVGPPAPHSPPSVSTPDYFVSSIVCFGAGIIGTVLIVVWLRRRGENMEKVPLAQTLEPSGV